MGISYPNGSISLNLPSGTVSNPAGSISTGGGGTPPVAANVLWLRTVAEKGETNPEDLRLRTVEEKGNG